MPSDYTEQARAFFDKLSIDWGSTVMMASGMSGPTASERAAFIGRQSERLAALLRETALERDREWAKTVDDVENQAETVGDLAVGIRLTCAEIRTRMGVEPVEPDADDPDYDL